MKTTVADFTLKSTGISFALQKILREHKVVLRENGCMLSRLTLIPVQCCGSLLSKNKLT